MEVTKVLPKFGHADFQQDATNNVSIPGLKIPKYDTVSFGISDSPLRVNQLGNYSNPQNGLYLEELTLEYDNSVWNKALAQLKKSGRKLTDEEALNEVRKNSPQSGVAELNVANIDQVAVDVLKATRLKSKNTTVRDIARVGTLIIEGPLKIHSLLEGKDITAQTMEVFSTGVDRVGKITTGSLRAMMGFAAEAITADKINANNLLDVNELNIKESLDARILTTQTLTAPEAEVTVNNLTTIANVARVRTLKTKDLLANNLAAHTVETLGNGKITGKLAAGTISLMNGSLEIGEVVSLGKITFLENESKQLKEYITRDLTLGSFAETFKQTGKKIKVVLGPYQRLAVHTTDGDYNKALQHLEFFVFDKAAGGEVPIPKEYITKFVAVAKIVK